MTADMSSRGLSAGSGVPQAQAPADGWIPGTRPGMTEYWFKPKAYGYGASPSNWKGWAATTVFAMLVLGVTLLPVKLQLSSGTDLPAWQIVLWAAVVAALTMGFIRLARAKTDGQWGWRWGKYVQRLD